jgi:hypothetical protein
MGKSLSSDSILAALAALSVTVVCTGCSKTESASPAPESLAPAAAPSAIPNAAPPAIATAPPTDDRAVDAGTELKVAPRKATQTGAAPDKGASASCGAQGCSPEMKKGSK